MLLSPLIVETEEKALAFHYVMCLVWWIQVLNVNMHVTNRGYRRQTNKQTVLYKFEKSLHIFWVIT